VTPVRLAILLAALLSAAPSFAFDNEPSGFRGVDWGTPLGAVRGKVKLVFNRAIEADIAEYRSQADLRVAGVPLLFNFYRFYRGRLSEGIMFTDFSQRANLEQVLTARFGTPQDKAGRQVVWAGKTTIVVLTCGSWEKACSATFQSVALAEEVSKNRAATAKSSKDF